MSMPAGDMPTLPKIATPQSAYDKAEEEGDAERVPSMRSVRSGASSRSSLTGLTTASLRKEVSVSLPGSSLDFHSRLSHGSATRFCASALWVHEAVAAEVARIVEPLKEKLQTEQTARQRLESMLRTAKGGTKEEVF
ncbi:unnamed protein product [Cladocopium goreaui]|uniref:Uncharacterized protein n=1 Tax=Cladocopium goreaui TaxID=2562237 RepID=A0A9P1GFC6_9DINO|nr:unnamed protein product [Cladocopium goreaui]